MSNRFLEIDGESTEAYGLLMLDGSEPYKPAPVTSRIVEIAGSSRHVDATEFSTGHPEYSPVTGERAEFLVEPSLLGMEDTREGREAIVTAFVREVHGQRCEVVDSLHPLHTMDCRCSVDVDEHSGWRTLSLTWTRQAVRRMADGTATLTSPWEQAEFDAETAVGPFSEEPTGFDMSEAGWEYSLVGEKPVQYSGTPSVGTASCEPGQYSTWDSSAVRLTTQVNEKNDISTFRLTGDGVTASDFTLDGNCVDVGRPTTLGDRIEVKYVLYADGVRVASQNLVTSQDQSGAHIGVLIGAVIPAGTHEVSIEVVVVNEWMLGNATTTSFSSLAARLKFSHVVEYGDPDFDYTGYYEYVDGEGMESASYGTCLWGNNPSMFGNWGDDDPWTFGVVVSNTVEGKYVNVNFTYDRSRAVPISYDGPEMGEDFDALSVVSWFLVEGTLTEGEVRGRLGGAASYVELTRAHSYGNSSSGPVTFSPGTLPQWTLGLVFTASDTPLAVPSETVAAVGQAPAYADDLYYASYTDISLTETIDSDTGYPSALSAEVTHPCAMTLGGRSVSLEEGEWTTDLLMERGDNEVSIDVPATGAYDEDTGTVTDFTANLTWRRGDL